ncbi:unnamed protein product [Penicillium nalgiovense]|nr:unnamed protein product [Penicillium nalgiovense]
MTTAEGAKEIIAEVSNHDLDQWVRTASFTSEIEETLGALAAECLAYFKWLEKYLVSRGGRSKPTGIEATTFEWPDNPIEPVGPCKEALFVEKSLLEDLERLCSWQTNQGTLHCRTPFKAVKKPDNTVFLPCKHTRHVKNLADLLQQVVRASKQPGLGLYLLDRELRHTDGIVPWDSANDTSQQHDDTTEV